MVGLANPPVMKPVLIAAPVLALYLPTVVEASRLIKVGRKRALPSPDSASAALPPSTVIKLAVIAAANSPSFSQPARRAN